MIQSQPFLSRRQFLLQCNGLLAGGVVTGQQLHGEEKKKVWKIAIHMDTAIPSLGFHGLHTAFHGLPNVDIVALFETNTKNLGQKVADTRAKRHYTDYAELLQKESPDIVVLTSRLPNLHLEQIRQTAEKGCHIYCEKPLSAYLQEADEIIKIAEQNRIKIAMAHPCRNGLGFVTMKKLIESGKIGTPLTVQGWGKSDHRGGGEDMMTLGTHIFDLMVYLLGAPEDVTADVRVQGEPFVGPELNKTFEDVGPVAGDEIFATFRFAGGVRGTFESRRNLYNSKTNRMGLSVIGSKGMLSLRFSDADKEPQPLRFSNSPCAPADESFAENIPLKEERVIPSAEPLIYTGNGLPQGPIFAEAGRFAAWDLMRSIEDDKLPVANLYDARVALEMINGVYLSHLTKTMVKLPLADRRHPLRDFKKPTI